MRYKTALVLLILFCPCVGRAADPQLYRLDVSDVPVENGKILNMEFDEVARDDRTSTVQITRRSGGSVSSSMFIMRGMCGLTRLRGKQNFVSKRVDGEQERYIVSFPDAAPEDGTGFSISQCDLMRY